MNDLSLIRFASGSKKLPNNNLELSAYDAIAALHQLHDRFREQWVSLWLLCGDGFVEIKINVSTDASLAIKQINEHGGAIGLVGLAYLKSKNAFLVVSKPFRRDAKSLKLLEKSRQQAETLTTQIVARAKKEGISSSPEPDSTALAVTK